MLEDASDGPLVGDAGDDREAPTAALTDEGVSVVNLADEPCLAGRTDQFTRLTLRGFEVEWDEDVPGFFTHAVECVELRDLEIERFRGRQAGETGSALRLDRGEDAVVRNSRATEGTDAFVEATGVGGRVLVEDNDLRRARRPSVTAAASG